MGAIFFYIFIYFIAYYASAVLNMLTVRPLITNRFMAALIPVFAVAMSHGYMIVSKPPPQGQDITVESAFIGNIIVPILVVVMGAFYFSWNKKGKDEEEAARNNEEADDDNDDYDDEDNEVDY